MGNGGNGGDVSDEQLRDIITTSRFNMLVRASEYKRLGLFDQARGIEVAIAILDNHIRRVLKVYQDERGSTDGR